MSDENKNDVANDPSHKSNRDPDSDSPEPSSCRADATVSGGSAATARDEQQPENLFQLIVSIINWLGPFKWVGLTLIAVVALLSLAWASLPNETKIQLIAYFTSDQLRLRAVGYYPGVEIDSVTHTVDLTEWTPIPPSDDKSSCCKVTWDVRGGAGSSGCCGTP